MGLMDKIKKSISSGLSSGQEVILYHREKIINIIEETLNNLVEARGSKIKEEDIDVEIVSFKLSGIFIPKKLE